MDRITDGHLFAWSRAPRVLAASDLTGITGPCVITPAIIANPAHHSVLVSRGNIGPLDVQLLTGVDGYYDGEYPAEVGDIVRSVVVTSQGPAVRYSVDVRRIA